MNKRYNVFTRLFFSLLMMMFLSPCIAEQQLMGAKELPDIHHVKTVTPKLTPNPPVVGSKAFILVDVNSGKVIAEKDSNKHIAPASLTKMMTLYIVSEALKDGRIKLDDQVVISKNAWHTGGSRMFLKVGQHVKIEDLMKGIIVQSGNDACVALAEFIAGSEKEFSEMMNHTAKQLGMSESHFTDSTGMPNANHYSTPRDLAILGQALMRDFPDYYAWYKLKWFTFNGIRQPNRNRLLWRDPSVDGIKTGHTSEAGFCLVASANKDDMRLLTVVIGSASDEDRASSAQQLLHYGFHYFKTYTLYKAQQVLEKPHVWMGNNNQVEVGLAEDLTVTIPRGDYKHLQAIVEVQKTLKAPILKNQTVGKLVLKLNDTTISEYPLVALQGETSGGFWSRLKDHTQLTLYNWFGIENT